jgi:hypothetical protein
VHECGNRKAASKIDDQRAVWEGATEALRSPERDKIAGAGPGSPGKANLEKSFHVASPRGAAA